MAPEGKDGLAGAGAEAVLDVSSAALSRAGLGSRLLGVAADGLASAELGILHLLQVICNSHNQLVFCVGTLILSTLQSPYFTAMAGTTCLTIPDNIHKVLLGLLQS